MLSCGAWSCQFLPTWGVEYARVGLKSATKIVSQCFVFRSESNMVRIWSHALYALALLGLAACGGGGGGDTPANTPPIANFSFKCTDLVCTFTSTSTDSDAGSALVAYGWNFGYVGAGSTAVAKDVPPVTYAAAGAYDVTLPVADNLGATATVVRKVTVTAPAAGARPPSDQPSNRSARSRRRRGPRRRLGWGSPS